MANWPLNRAKACSPQASQAWTITSVSLCVRNRWPRASSSARSSTWLKISPLKTTHSEPSSFVSGCWPVVRSMIDRRACAEAGPPVAIDAELVGAAVAQGADHRHQVVERGFRQVVPQGDRPGDAAHGQGCANGAGT